MKLTQNEVNQILKILPIGYYAKTGINVECSSGNKCYFDNSNDKIVIGYDIVNLALEKVPEDFNPEVAVRTILYHEVSHLILSSKVMVADAKHYAGIMVDHLFNHNITISNQEAFDLINIFEDERIETIFKTYYMLTDFKWFVKSVNGTQKPTDARQYFYSVVRFRNCENTSILQMVEDLIIKYKWITRDKSSIYTSDGGWIYIKNYVKDIAELYIACTKEFNNNQKEDDNPNSSSENKPEDSNIEINEVNNNQNNVNELQPKSEDEEEKTKSDNNSSPSEEDKPKDKEEEAESNNDSSTPEEDDESGETEDIEESDNAQSEDGGTGEDYSPILSNEELDQLFTNTFCGKINSKMIDEFRRIFKQFKTRGNVGGHTNAYSGVINPRNIVNNDYKYFTRTNTDNNGGAGKLHLNLWIDCSGSYQSNEAVTNQIIKALEIIERENKIFSFDVIEINCGVIIKNKNDRYINANGGNTLSSKYFEAFRKMQRPDARNYNIVLYDGQAWYSKSELSNFKAWDHDNVFIIADECNAKYIKTKCKSAKTLFVNYWASKSYAEILEEKIYNILRVAFGA